MSTLERRQDAGTWAAENNLIRFTLTDNARFPMKLEATIADPNNNLQGNYDNYRQVRIQEDSSGRYIFYGKVEKMTPEWDGAYGQVFVIFARDNLQEMLQRYNETNYTGFTQRSALIAQIISDYSTSISGTANISTADTQKFETSARTEGAGVIDSNFEDSGMAALRSIYEIAEEDPWEDGTSANVTGLGRAFYLDHGFNGDAPIPDLHLFNRNSRPATTPLTHGLSVRLEVADGNQTRSMLHDYNFPQTPKELVTLVRAEFADDNGVITDRTFTVLNHGAITGGPFTVGETITWAGGGSATVETNDGTNFTLISSWANLNTAPGAVITGGSSAATATVNATTASPPGVLALAIEQENQKILQQYELKHLDRARNRAAQLLVQGGNSIQRGEFRIVRWPYSTFVGTNSGTSATLMTHAGGDFINKGVREGDILENTTDSTTGTITTVTATTLEVSAGGMSWDPGDEYRVRVIVRAGHRIHVINSNVSYLSVGLDMLVTQIVYDEGPGVAYARLKVLGGQGGDSRGTEHEQTDLVKLAHETERSSLRDALVSATGNIVIDSRGITITQGDYLYFRETGQQDIRIRHQAAADYLQIAVTGGVGGINLGGDSFIFTTSLTLDSVSGGAGSFLSLGGSTHNIRLPPWGTNPGETEELRFYELAANGNQYVGFKAPDSVTGIVVWDLPPADGAANQVMKTDGGGNLSWDTVLFNPATGNLDMGGFDITNVDDIIPATGTGHQLGDATDFWDSIYVDNLFGNSGVITANTSIRPEAKKTRGLGTGALTWSSLYIDEVRFTEDGAGVNYVSFRAPGSIASDVTWDLPNADGAANQVIKTSGAGALSWDTVLFNPATADLNMNTNNITNIDQLSGTASTLTIASAMHPDAKKTRNLGTGALTWFELYIDKVLFVEDGVGINHVGFDAPASIASDVVWTLPNADGSANQVLATNGSGTLSWSGRARVATGTYTGNGSTSQGITGVGFQPVYVRIWDRQTSDSDPQGVIETTDTIIDDNASGGAHTQNGVASAVQWESGVFVSDAIISLDADGFTVDDGGGDFHPNKNTIVYNYLAIG